MTKEHADHKSFHANLSGWYAQHGRHDLPWRNTRDAYHIYLSEIMLQQTQVETVRLRFYPQFLKKFPTLATLAKSSEQEVLTAWQGLGYYTRARNLYKAAQACNGELPSTVEGLLALPGIGRNTAHAVAAFAYHQPVAVMEANVKRVLCRIFALRNPNEAELWQRAGELLNRADPFDYNQAMMDIGAMICNKRAPKCDECPANNICVGKTNPAQYPQAKKKNAVPVRYKHIIVEIDNAGRIHATPRTTRFLHGMYHFTEQENPPQKAATKLGKIEQSYSHFTLKAEIYKMQRDSRFRVNDSYTLAELYALPMSMAEKKILRLLGELC